MIKLQKEYLHEIQQLLALYVPDCEVLAFGSRVHGNPDKWSDLDLTIKGKQPLSFGKLSMLKDIFSATNIPISVDLVDWHKISPEFQKIIAQSCESIQTPSC